MDRSFLKALVTQWRTEPALFLYMLGSYIKMPVFQNLLFEKSCWELYNVSCLSLGARKDDDLCSNVTAYHKDEQVQSLANSLFFYSSLTLTIPSIPSSLMLGSLVDKSRIRLSILIPLIALVISSFVYIGLSIWEHSSPYYLLISDFIFGIAGGYTSIIGVSAAYSVRGSMGNIRSARMARLEAAIGLGGCIGSFLSGKIRAAFGYTVVFSIITVLQVFAIIYVLLFVKDEVYEEIPDSQPESSFIRRSLIDPLFVLTRLRPLRIVLIACFCAFGLELFAFSGMSDIQFSFMRFQLAWDDVAYGQFTSLSSLFGTLGVIFLYPFLRLLISDVFLGSIGLVLKMTFLLVLSFSTSSLLMNILSILFIGSRFVSTAFRTQIANLVEEDEQGQMSSLVSILEGVAGILATAVLNNLFPLTLSIWAGICPLSIVGLLGIALIILIISSFRLSSYRREEEGMRDETQSTTTTMDAVDYQ
ncbi:hypothetical protein PENTCL1PPCAC_18358 [Pristionchus entomophagus]|uniref:Membrane transporter n=1 Tax=Pristionchus entomophagus TaxID=358040 RepID=A0AAV5TQ92_9BILA|nr:hypothetical protein PENTCL1PPCAC_18358 [Pristionchus entomophagus]